MRYTVLFVLVFALIQNVHAFPVGKFKCVSGDLTVTAAVSEAQIGGETLPLIKLKIKNGELESNSSGVGTVIEIRENPSASLDRRLKLPGTNFEFRFDDKDEPSSRHCQRI